MERLLYDAIKLGTALGAKVNWVKQVAAATKKSMRIIFIFLLFSVFYIEEAPAQNPVSINSEIKQRKANKQRLEAQAKVLSAEQKNLRASLIKLATQIKDTEATQDRLEARLSELNKGEQVLKERLKKNRVKAAQTLAGLQMLQSDQPPPFLVAPNDAQAALRGAVLLAGIIPETKSRANVLRGQLAELAAVQSAIGEQRAALAQAEAAHTKQRGELNIALSKKHKAEAAARAAAKAESQEIAALVKEARTIRDLSFRLKARQKNKKDAPSKFAKERGKISLPVAGKIAGRFGAPDAQGSPRQGLAIAARSGAQVVAPYDGEILYAGAFRQYGNIVILRIDGAYQLVLSGLAGTQNYVGQAILAGEPIGTLPSKSEPNGSRPKKNTRQALYVELRYKGEPIDPAPFFN